MQVGLIERDTQQRKQFSESAELALLCVGSDAPPELIASAFVQIRSARQEEFQPSPPTSH